MANNVVSAEVAEMDVTQWLDYKKTSKKEREAYKGMVDLLIEAVEEGYLEFNHDTKKVTHHLKFPLEFEVTTSKLEYAYRINTGDVTPFMRNVKAGDVAETYNAHIVALTKAPIGIIRALDTEDKKIAGAIAVFFMAS